MRVMAVNAGGSSLKFSVIDTRPGRTLLKGAVESIGQQAGTMVWEDEGKKERETTSFPDHRAAVEAISHRLSLCGYGAEVEAVGHRVAHGGTSLRESTLIDDEVLGRIELLSELAPLHNPPAALGIRVFRELVRVPHVAVFDTAFHANVPPRAHTYGLPLEITESGVRRFGFHGLAFSWMVRQGSQLIRRRPEDLKIVSMMLGSGTTANACLHGVSIDVSTGFTPIPGLLQSTRTGDIDPGVLLYLQKKHGYGPDDLEHILYKKSGWLGVSGRSANMKDIIEASAEDPRSRLAMDVLIYSALKYAGAYAAALGGMDLLIFGGGVGERSPEIRKGVAEGLGFLGLELDDEKNQAVFSDGVISTAGSRIAVAVVEVREDMVIAEETAKVVRPGAAATAH